MARKKVGVDEWMLIYRRLWRDRYGVPSVARCSMAFRARFEAAAGSLGWVELVRRLERYLADDDKWLVAKRHDVTLLFTFLDRYVDVFDVGGCDGPCQHGEFDVCEELKKLERRGDDRRERVVRRGKTDVV